jgi:acyl-CoA reductase-like NAD-dependent aldehyde dehydrogenase
VADEFASRVAAIVSRLRLGDPRDENTQVGPVITPSAAARVQAYVQSARDGGATVLSGGSLGRALPGVLRPDGFHEPTVLWREEPDPDLYQEEVFGPVLTVIPFSSETEAGQIANSTPFGLGSGIWTR